MSNSYCLVLSLLLSALTWDVAAFVFTPVIIIHERSPTPNQNYRKLLCRPSPDLFGRRRTNIIRFLATDETTEKEQDKKVINEKIDTKNRAIDDVQNHKQEKTLFDSFLASFPELSFWEAAQDNELKLRKRDLIRAILRRLANLSLQDYSWRSSYFKATEADRRVDESLARMMGEDVTYVRPMDAGDDKIGPLGTAEKKLVEWLYLVIEEEGKRARKIASSEGDLVRPMDLKSEGGPLSSLEYAAVSFLNRIRDSEKERAKTMTLRPKDLEEEKRGPLGEAEYRVVRAFEEIKKSEMLRMNQSRERGGEVVRPIDVPGPLGELERWYVELFSAEVQRGEDLENEGKFVRPKDASLTGPMGDAEKQVSDAIEVIKTEETERLRSIQKVLIKNRPMENDRESALGLIEAIIVGILKGPQLIFRVFDRVNELLQSSNLTNEDDDVLKEAYVESNKKKELFIEERNNTNTK